MKRAIGLLTMVLLLSSCAGTQTIQEADGWIPLFDGESLDGWRASENEGTFTVQDGEIVVDGPRSHLYYVGPVQNHDFKNFEFQADVLTLPGSNSGIYFHTEYQEDGWPSKGYEVQINNSHTDWKRTAGLYNIEDVREAPADDNEWFTVRIVVQDRQIQTYVDGDLVVDYTEPVSGAAPENNPGRVLSSGTFALQGHDPESEVHYRNILVRPLPG